MLYDIFFYEIFISFFQIGKLAEAKRMKDRLLRKGLILGIIILFVGASIISNILVKNVKADGLDTILYDHFDDNMLDPSWSVNLEDALDASYVESGTELTVTDIDSEFIDTGSPGSDTPWGILRFSQMCQALGDFHVDLNISWDSEGSNAAMQQVYVQLCTSDGDIIAYGGYRDPWVGFRGIYLAFAGNNGWEWDGYRLPLSGSSTIEIERINGLVSVYWDGNLLIDGSSTHPVERIDICFSHYSYSGEYGTSFFATETVDLINVEGESWTSDYLNYGLVGSWSFDEGTGSTAHDSSGNGNDGTLINMDTSSCWVDGISGTALSFDGMDDYVEVTADTSLDLTSFTITTWFKIDELPEDGEPSRCILTKGESQINGNANYGMYIVHDSTWDWGSGARLMCRFETASDWDYRLVSDDSLDSSYVGKFVHVACTLYGDNWKLYIDGQEVATSMYKGYTEISNLDGEIPSTASAPLYIGAWFSSSGDGIGNDEMMDFFSGIVDEVRIYNRALSEDEIKDLYINTGLVGYWNFDEGSGSTAYDGSGYSNDGAIYGATWTSGISGSALYFDGVDDYVMIGDSISLNPSEITVIVWVKINEMSIEYAHIISKWGPVGNAGYALYLQNDATVGFSIHDGTSNTCVTSTPLIPNKWYQVVASVDGSSLKIYLNGNFVNFLNSNSQPMDDTNTLTFGKENTINKWYFNGVIDEVHIYDRALSEAEIQTLYNQGGGNRYLIYATREGLVGETTANEHLITGDQDELFVALPSWKVKCLNDNTHGHDYEVRITYNDESVIAPVWDIGPWNTKDDYWNPSSERDVAGSSPIYA